MAVLRLFHGSGLCLGSRMIMTILKFYRKHRQGRKKKIETASNRR